MSVATLNPFALLDGDAPKTTPAETVQVKVTPAKTTTTTKTAESKTKTAKTAEPKTKTIERELNVDAMPPTDRPKEPRRSNGNGPRRPAPTNERQARRATDRHSRTGYKQDGEKKMTAGKASWGREGEVLTAETVDASASVESVEAEETVEIEEGVKHLTLAQYQAQLKKPSTIAAPKVRTVAPIKAGEVLNKKPLASETLNKTTPTGTAKATANKIDLSKYIAVKAVGEITTEQPRQQQRSFNNDKKRPTSTNNVPASPKVNLKDERAFPALGKK